MKTFFKITICSCLLVIFFTNCQHTIPVVKTKIVEPSSIDNQTTAQLKAIEKVIQERVIENDISALSVGIIKNNKIISYHNIGTTKRRNQENVNENTVYQLASLSKTFTGIISKELVTEGKLDLQASITNYLPKSLSQAAIQKLAPIKIHHLLKHRAGFPRDAKYAKRPWKFLDGPMVGGYSETSILKDLEELALIAQPDEKCEYSNLGFGTMGYILERAADMPLADLYEKYLGNKYGMQRTTMDLDKAKALGMATPYMKWWRNKTTSPWEMGYLRSGGGLCSTTSDLCKMMEQQLVAYNQFENNQQSSPLVLMEDKTSWADNDGYPYYGYGSFGYNKTIDSTLVHYGHSGDVDGFASIYTFFPNQQIGMVLLTSSGGMWVHHLEWAIQDILLEIEPRKAIQVAPESIAQYFGEYKFNHNQIISVSQEEGVLKAELPRIGIQEIAAYAPNKFFLKNYPSELIFEDNRLRYVDGNGNHFIGQKAHW